MRLPYLGTPNTGELIPSGLARLWERGVPTAFIMETIGVRINTVWSAFPSFLSRLAASVPRGHPWADSQYAATNHTTFNYYAYFDSDQSRRQLLSILTAPGNPAFTKLSLA